MIIRLPKLKEDLLNDILLWLLGFRIPAYSDLRDFIDRQTDFRQGDPELKDFIYNFNPLKLRDRNNLDQSIYHIKIAIHRTKSYKLVRMRFRLNL
jgi:hypothetical protein